MQISSITILVKRGPALCIASYITMYMYVCIALLVFVASIEDKATFENHVS